MQLLRDNLTLWTSDMSEGNDEISQGQAPTQEQNDDDVPPK